MNNFDVVDSIQEKEVEIAKNLLSIHAINAVNNNSKFEQAYQTVYDDDYSFESLKRSKIKECTCKDAKFISAAFTGSIFEETDIINCDFTGASLDFCLFYDCRFFSDKPEGGFLNTNLGNANFIQCKWENLFVSKSVLSNILFEKNIFNGCTLEYSSFENTIFQSCQFKDMELRNINLEFSEFVTPTFTNVVLPFAQIPYVFGLLNELTKNNVEIHVSSSGNQKELSITEYLELLPQIIPFYIKNEEFFPAANIYISLQEYEKAYQAILNGMRKASSEKDFRMLKHFCKLAVLSGWCDRKKIKTLYSFIYDIKNFEPMISYQRHNYYLHLGDFRKILLFNTNTSPTLNVRLQTNILPEETENIALLIENLNQLITVIGKRDVISSVELHHESPYEVILFIVGGLILLKCISENIHVMCEPVKDIQEIIINDQQIKINKFLIKENEQRAKDAEEIVKKGKEQLSVHNIEVKVNSYITNYYIQEK